MGPVKATTVPVSTEAAMKTRRLSRSASTPSCTAASSPSARRLSSRAWRRISQKPSSARPANTASEPAGIGARLPSSQCTTPPRRLKSTIEMSTVIAEVKKIPTMTPASSSVWMDSPPGITAIR
jgi:hypothetical protein